jgi:hypothetical protein
MERTIITISENGNVNIPIGNVWMSEMELVELFRVIAPTLRAAIKTIYVSGTLNPATTQRCDLATAKSWATFYNLEVVIAIAPMRGKQDKKKGVGKFVSKKSIHQ